MKELLEKLENIDKQQLNEFNIFGNKIYADEVALIQAELKINKAYSNFSKIYAKNNPIIAELEKNPKNKKVQEKIAKKLQEVDSMIKAQILDMYKSVNLNKIRKEPTL